MPRTKNVGNDLVALLEKMLKEHQGAQHDPSPMEAIFEAQNARIEEARQECILEYGIDPTEKNLDFSNPKFSCKKFLREARTQLNITETVGYSALAAVARVGVLKVITTLYQRQDFNWTDLVTVVPADSWSTFMTAMYDSDIPRRVALGEEADESRLIGKNFEIVNHEYARILRIPKRLIDDDQTGQTMMKAGRLGKGMSLREYKEVIAIYIGNATTWTNKAGSGADVSGPNFESAYNTLRKVKDPLNEYMAVLPDMVLVDSTRAFRTDKILHSEYQTDQPSGVAGDPGYFMTKNVLEDKFDIHESPFVTDTNLTSNGVANGDDGSSPRWYMMQSGVGVYFTDREPLQVTQEIPGAGKSWTTRSLAFQVTRRFGTALVDDYAIYAGNGN